MSFPEGVPGLTQTGGQGVRWLITNQKLINHPQALGRELIPRRPEVLSPSQAPSGPSDRRTRAWKSTGFLSKLLVILGTHISSFNKKSFQLSSEYSNSSNHPSFTHPYGFNYHPELVPNPCLHLDFTATQHAPHLGQLLFPSQTRPSSRILGNDFHGACRSPNQNSSSPRHSPGPAPTTGPAVSTSWVSPPARTSQESIPPLLKPSMSFPKSSPSLIGQLCKMHTGALCEDASLPSDSAHIS